MDVSSKNSQRIAHILIPNRLTFHVNPVKSGRLIAQCGSIAMLEILAWLCGRVLAFHQKHSLFDLDKGG